MLVPLLKTLLVVVAVFALVTLVALEGGEVAILHTVAPGVEARTTRVWVARAEGALWVEAADENRPFLRDLVRTPVLDVEIDGRHHACIAEIVPEPGGHERIRAMLAERYGWRDRWIALLQDTSGSRAVRLVEPRHGEPERSRPAAGESTP